MCNLLCRVWRWHTIDEGGKHNLAVRRPVFLASLHQICFILEGICKTQRRPKSQSQNKYVLLNHFLFFKHVVVFILYEHHWFINRNFYTLIWLYKGMLIHNLKWINPKRYIFLSSIYIIRKINYTGNEAKALWMYYISSITGKAHLQAETVIH